MLYPPLNQLTEKINSKYLVATTAAKRARELEDKEDTELLERYRSKKAVGRALEEIAGGKVYPDKVEK
ncbi:DNA-directed RNA polymerase subunit omega [Staphylococcus arlettae]|uniref:DNA-directed RNA polymerase subunit omega n=2 Tax=Staphylococcus arlettae TaxID=29378 RepID=UPI00113ED136|nr:DNA-directed RNA polymerase subunit omega [Staphylococcus arlettae]MCD9054693.1 DNA-directed RNA polymerase subunit omega [Staphylococcus arlettae]MCP8715711.1 DNA-directed RNA polymerase subunit omega [Staphylococcus arlettae]MDN0188253.1 DNA-directed RNA polymerase subunit omega [Staphylococcus arlettae]BBK28452.1 DNA-directed RNA polymerase subunit omega [Staphylococcus arlettae]